jgi:hypothetical protein
MAGAVTLQTPEPGGSLFLFVLGESRRHPSIHPGLYMGHVTCVMDTEDGEISLESARVGTAPGWPSQLIPLVTLSLLS